MTPENTNNLVGVKICGLTNPEDVACAVEAGAAFIGFVFVPGSPRFVSAEQAAQLIAHVPEGIMTVGLFANQSPTQIQDILDVAPLGMLQLHGQESPKDVAKIRSANMRPVMKAIGIGTINDLAEARAHAQVADMLLFDHKPGAGLAGGTGKLADWPTIAQWRGRKPWMLAGGLNEKNIAQAVAETGAGLLDVSSGVERSRGVKDCGLIKAFMQAAKNLHI